MNCRQKPHQKLDRYTERPVAVHVLFSHISIFGFPPNFAVSANFLYTASVMNDGKPGSLRDDSFAAWFAAVPTQTRSLLSRMPVFVTSNLLVSTPTH